MTDDRIVLIERTPSVGEFQELHQLVGWRNVGVEATRCGLEHALYSACLMRGDEVIGCGRVLGDGGIYFYIQDIIVRPDYQRRGLGTRIMDAIMKWLDANAPPNAFVALMAAKGVAGWYEKYGFRRRAEDAPGMFRYW